MIGNLLRRILGINTVYVVADIENGVMHNKPVAYHEYSDAKTHYDELTAFADDNYDVHFYRVNIQ